jgi:copper chaperone CopZ
VNSVARCGRCGKGYAFSGSLKGKLRLPPARPFRYDTTMKFMVILLAFMGILLGGGCRVTDVRELTVNVPGMASDSDVERIRKALSPLNGVNKEQAVFDVKGHTIKVSYDSMVVATKNIELAIAEAGYDANGITAASAHSKK